MHLGNERPSLLSMYASLPACAIGFLFLLMTTPGVFAKVENRTIDDYWGDSVTGERPLYLPDVQHWNFGPNCTTCRLRADGAHMDTWYETTVSIYDLDTQVKNITLRFTGTSLYVFCIIPNRQQDNTTIATVNLDFTLDGSPAGNFYHFPTDSNNNYYNYPVYTNTALTNEEHNFTLTPTPSDRTNGSVVLFDYAIYTHEDIETTSITSTVSTSSTSAVHSPSASQTKDSKSTPVGAIAGGVVGGVVALLIGVLLGIFCIRKRRNRRLHHVTHEKSGHGAVGPSEGPRYQLGASVPPTAEASASSLYKIPSQSYTAPSLGANDPLDKVLLPPGSAGPASAMTPRLSSPSPAPNAGSQKAAMRQQELEQRLREMQRQTDAGGVSSLGTGGSGGDVFPSVAGTSRGEGALRAEVGALRAEVERLRLESTAPPAYDYPQNRGTLTTPTEKRGRSQARLVALESGASSVE